VKQDGILRTIKGNNTPIRAFYINNRSKLEAEISSKCPKSAQLVIDKLFSTVGDFTERHEAVHCGSFIKVEEIENYDAILTKIRDVVKVLLDNKLL